ncbi:MAG: DUF2273 domain-containing protein [Atopobiaceae bacterium]|nr:DUF2273 domain-containing protein [Atopobiaceae bacterium]
MEETKAPKVKIDQTPEPEAEEVLTPGGAAEAEEALASDEAVSSEEAAEEAVAAAEEELADAADAEADVNADAAANKAEVIQPAGASAPAARGFSAWLTLNFPGHEHAVLGGFCGLTVALLVFAIGVARVLFMLVCITIGVLIGQYLDGDNRIVRVIRRLLGGDQN